MFSGVTPRSEKVSDIISGKPPLPADAGNVKRIVAPQILDQFTRPAPSRRVLDRSHITHCINFA
jgi:hypothetical protein